METSGTIQSPAGTAPADAFEPLGEEVRRPVDCWIECDPAAPPEDATQRLREAARQLANPHEEGLRLRFVKPSVSAQDCLMNYLPNVLENLDAPDAAFFHAELMEGPESGIYVAIDNRKPALIVQQWLGQASDPFELPDTIRPGQPLHVNLHLHRSDAPLFDVGDRSESGGALQRINGPIHQLTVARSAQHPSGISVGVEAIHNEEGAPGGLSAVEQN